MDIKELYSIFVKCGSVATDSRAIRGGELFFALKGENFDGNEYAVKALEAGAAYGLATTSCAIRSPGSITNGSSDRFTRRIFSSPR